MLEKVSQIAEQAATNVSRRGFLGRLGRGAAATAAALGGLLALPAATRAGRGGRICADPSTVPQCSGLPVGSPCVAPGGVEGKCSAKKKVAGVYDCNVCRVPGTPPRGPRRRQ